MLKNNDNYNTKPSPCISESTYKQREELPSCCFDANSIYRGVLEQETHGIMFGPLHF